MSSVKTAKPMVGSRLTFNADWTVTQSGPLISGQPIEIDYAAARLLGAAPEVPVANERHCWTITGYFKVDDGQVISFPAASDAAPARAAVEPQVDKLGSGALEVWFEMNDLYGQNRYDSDYGRNFRFKVYPRVIGRRPRGRSGRGRRTGRETASRPSPASAARQGA